MPRVWFPPKTIRKKMESLRLSEDDVLDAFHNRTPFRLRSGRDAITRKYGTRYEIGLTYTRDERTGEYIVITGVWKRARMCLHFWS